MELDLTQFGSEHEVSGLKRAAHSVQTPQPAADDGSGHSTERNRRYYYRHGNEYLTVTKVSDRGWSVWRYAMVDGTPESFKRIGAQLNAQMAHRLAIETGLDRS